MLEALNMRLFEKEKNVDADVKEARDRVNLELLKFYRVLDRFEDQLEQAKEEIGGRGTG